MNLSLPILISNQNEEFRELIRDMLTKNGFFHVMEAANLEETKTALTSANEPQLLLLEVDLIDEEIIKRLINHNSFIILARSDDPRTVGLAARLGTKHFLSFPFSSQVLLEKIKRILQ